MRSMNSTLCGNDRVGQEAHAEDQVAVGRHAVPVAEAGHVDHGRRRDGSFPGPDDLPTSPGSAVGTDALHIFGLDTRWMTNIPDSAGLFSPRCSSDGRYVLAMMTTRSWCFTTVSLQGRSFKRVEKQYECS